MIPALYHRKPDPDCLGIDVQVIRNGNFHVHVDDWGRTNKWSDIAPEGPSSAHRSFKESLPSNMRVGKWVIGHRSVSRSRGNHDVREVIDLFAHFPDEKKSKAEVIGRLLFEYTAANESWTVTGETLIKEHEATVAHIAEKCRKDVEAHVDTYDGEIVSNLVKSGTTNCGGVIVKRGRWFIPNEGDNLKNFFAFADDVEKVFPVRILTLTIPRTLEGLRATMLSITKKIEAETEELDEYVSTYVDEMENGKRERRQYTKEKERLQQIRSTVTYIDEMRSKMDRLRDQLADRLDDLDKAQADALFGWVSGELGRLKDTNGKASEHLRAYQKSLDLDPVEETGPTEEALETWDGETSEQDPEPAQEKQEASDPFADEFDLLFEGL